MILCNTRAAVRDNKYIGYTRSGAFLDEILNCGLIHNIEHFLGNSL